MAANPVEYALAALGSCQAITYRVWAAPFGVKLDEVVSASTVTLICAGSSASTTYRGSDADRITSSQPADRRYHD